MPITLHTTVSSAQLMHTIGGSHNCGQAKDCCMNVANAKAQPTQVQPKDCFRTSIATATRTSRGLTRCVCTSNGVPPQLRGPARARRKESFPQRPFQFIQGIGPASLTNSGASREAPGILSPGNDSFTCYAIKAASTFAAASFCL